MQAAKLPAEVRLYPYNSCDWLRVDAGDFTDGSCRPDPDFTARTLGLCRPRFRQAIYRRWEAGELSGGLDFAFFTRARRGADFALVAWLRLEKVYASHPIAAGTGRHQALNLMTPGSRCLCGVVYRGGAFRRSPRCGCGLYADRVGTPYLAFAPAGVNAVRVATPLRMSFVRLQSLVPGYFASKWARGCRLGEFMQAGQGWGHKITAPGDIGGLRHAFFGEPPSSSNAGSARASSTEAGVRAGRC